MYAKICCLSLELLSENAVGVMREEINSLLMKWAIRVVPNTEAQSWWYSFQIQNFNCTSASEFSQAGNVAHFGRPDAFQHVAILPAQKIPQICV